MIPRPNSRGDNNYTSFPAGNTSHSSIISERMGAFGALALEENSRLHPRSAQQQQAGSNHYRSRSQPQSSYDMQMEQNNRQWTEVPSGVRAPLAGRTPQLPTVSIHPQPRNTHETVYMSSVSNADTTDTRRKFDKLSEVYSTSGDTVQFAKNLGDYINEKIPYGITISILIALMIIAFVFGLIGTLNIPNCNVQPMIPIWLIVGACLFIISAIFRIYSAIPSPPPRRRNLSADLCCNGIELLFALANIVWLILGCGWVYGSKSRVHFQDQIFQEHYCESTVYWIAFSAATGYLVLICLLIIGLIGLLIVGSCKETERNSSQVIYQ